MYVLSHNLGEWGDMSMYFNRTKLQYLGSVTFQKYQLENMTYPVMSNALNSSPVK